ncbi:unnamed protein product, partial [Rotaria socialis]
MEAEELWDPIGNSAMNLYDLNTLIYRNLHSSAQESLQEIAQK